MAVEIVDARETHVGPVANNLSAETLETFRKIGIRPRAGLRRLMDDSAYCRAALVDGRPIALWGVMGSDIASSGEAWFSLTEHGRRQRKAIVRHAREELRAMLATKSELFSSILCSDARAKRFAEFLGFECVDQDVTPGGIPFFRGILRR